MKQLKNILTALFLFALLATVLVACKSSSAVLPTTVPTPTIDTTTKKVVVVKLHDTIFKTQKDSSFYKAYIECINGKPVINSSSVTSLKGKNVNVPNVNLKDGQLNVDCQVEAQKLFAQWKDQYTSTHQQIIKKNPYPVQIPLTWWQATQIKLGKVFLLLLVLILIAGGLRLAKFI